MLEITPMLDGVVVPLWQLRVPSGSDVGQLVAAARSAYYQLRLAHQLRSFWE